MNALNIDGLEINCHIKYPKANKGPAVLVLHAWWGLNDFIKEFCNKLANEGFFVIAPDLYSGKIANSIQEAEKYVQTVDDKQVEPVLMKIIDYLQPNEYNTSSSVITIGFSYGAAWASRLANINSKISKVVIFYGTGETDFSNTKASFLCHFAEDDPYEESKFVNMYLKALKDAGVEVKHYIYPGTHHWFFETDKKEYYKGQASQLAWKRTMEFLKS